MLDVLVLAGTAIPPDVDAIATLVCAGDANISKRIAATSITANPVLQYEIRTENMRNPQMSSSPRRKSRSTPTASRKK